MGRPPTWPGLRRHRSYTYEDAARATGRHKNTIMGWAKRDGLPVLTDAKPHLILGRDLIDFLHKQRADRRRRLQPGEMYCFACKVPRGPAGGMVDALPTNGRAVNLRALCEACHGVMHRRVARERVPEFEAAVSAADSGDARAY